MNTSEALEWLIEHGDDPDEEDFELPSLDASLDVDTGGPSSSGTSGRRRSLKEACVDLFKGGNVAV